MTLHPQFLVDSNGKKRKVVLSIKEYNELVELAQDAIDASLIEEVRHEPTVSWEEVRKKEDARRGIKK